MLLSEPSPQKLTTTLFASGALAALLFVLYLCAVASGSSDLATTLFVALWFWFIASIIAIPITVAVGVTSYFALTRIKALNALSAQCVGVASSMLTWYISGTRAPWWIFAVIGLVSAWFAWWRLSRQSRRAGSQMAATTSAGTD